MSELEIYQKQGFGNSSGIGQRPALLIIDFVNGFANPDQFGGGNIGEAIENTRGLLAEARALEVWPESHWPGFALREADVFKTYMAWWCM